MKTVLLSFLLIGVLVACNPARKAARNNASDSTAVAGDNPADSSSTDYTKDPAALLKVIPRIEYETFSGRVAVDYKDDKGKGNSFNVKLQLKKGEFVWLSATGPFGIEGARALITPDSVKILNRLQREYIEAGTAFLQEKLGLPVDFNTLQELLIGNPVFVNDSNAVVTRTETGYALNSQTAGFSNLLQILLPDFLPTTSELKDLDASKQRSAKLTYNDYQLIDGRHFPTARLIDVNYKTGLHIQLDFESHDFNGAVNTPFSVPSGYKRMRQ